MEVRVGTRVIRGPHWTWRDQDGGEGHLGSVAEVQLQEPAQGEEGRTPTRDPPGPRACAVTVQWDCGNRCRYRCGLGGKYDLRVFDSGPAGIVHNGQMCSGCGLDPITGMKWKCVRCHDYNICTECYMKTKHVLEHEFDRFDTTRDRVRVPARGYCKRKEVNGIFKFAEVVPWCDWQPQDGTEGAEKGGEVVRVCGRTQDDDNLRAFIEVQWKETDMKTIHMVGFEGKVELKCTDPSSGGYYYPDHLPLLGAPLPLPDPAAISSGDLVRVELEAEVFRAVQEGHGGWNDGMLEVIGKIGTVVGITDCGDLKVRYPEMVMWTFCSEAVVKVELLLYQVGELVRISSDLSKVQSLQQGHGGWDEGVLLLLGEVAKVSSVYSGGDVMVLNKGRSWVFNPLCLSPAEDTHEEVDPIAEWAKKDADKELQLGLHTMLSRGQPSTIINATSLCAINVLKKFLEKYPQKVNYVSGGRTALHFAASSGLLEAMKILLEYKADVEFQDLTSYRPIHMSAYNGCEETTQLLVDAGADVNSKTIEGSTALMMAAIRGNKQVLKVLLKYPGIDLSAQDSDGNTALHCAVMYQRTSCVLSLLEAGADPLLLNFNLTTCFHYASRMGYLPIVEMFLQRLPDIITAKDGYAYTILHCAALHDHPNIITLAMEEKKCEVDAKNDSGQTALHIALARGNAKSVEKLIDYGSTVNAVDVDGCSPLHYVINRDSMDAPSEESPKILKLHRALFGKLSEDMFHPMHNTIAVAAFLLRNGADMHLKSKAGTSPYQYMPFFASLMTILADYEMIIDQGGNVDGSPLLSVSNTTGKGGYMPAGKAHGTGKHAYQGSSDSAPHTSDEQHRTFMVSTVGDSEGYTIPQGYGGTQGYTVPQGYAPVPQGYEIPQDYVGTQGYGNHAGPQGFGGYGSRSQASYSSSSYSSRRGGKSAASHQAQAGGMYEDGGCGEAHDSRYQDHPHPKEAQQPKKSGSVPGSSSSSSTTTSSTTTSSSSRSSATTKPPVSTTSSSSSPTSPPTLPLSTKPSTVPPPSSDTGSQGPDLCSLCDNVVDVKFSPCGHAVMCNQCAPKAKRCPVCKVSVENVYNRTCINCRKKDTVVVKTCGHGFCCSCENSPVCAGCNDVT